jgi:pyruvate/2-oxoacid:ferredoxin oxidoreductase alpha subunit
MSLEEQARKGIVSFGSSAQFVLETVESLGLQDKVRVCIPELIHPLPDRFAAFVSSLEKLLVVEMSYSAQFYHYLRSQIDLPSDTEVCARAGGMSLSRKELSGPVTKLAR